MTRQTNSSQATTATRVYDAFGNLESTTGAPQSPFGFVGGQGYQEDGDSGLKLLGHRYYDPSTGRFLTRDALKDGRNWYGYCENNPNLAVDPNGNQSKSGGDKGRMDDPRMNWSKEDLDKDSKLNPGNRPRNNRILKYRKERNVKKRQENNYQADPVTSPVYSYNPQPVPTWVIVGEGAVAVGIILFPEVSVPVGGLAYLLSLF